MKRGASKIKALIFDIGGVLCLPKNKKNESVHIFNSFKESLRLSKLVNMKDKKMIGRIRSIYFKSSTGEISKEETLKLFSKQVNVKERKIEKIFYDVYKRNILINKPLMKLAQNLKKNGYKLGIITDQWHLSKKAVVYEGEYSFFDSIVVSCDDKAKKPKNKPYFLLLNRLKIKANEALFIDDRMRNIKPAKKLGMKTILFKNNTQFFTQIKKFNL
ncbi:MAG: HAD family phosphatase [Nanoarchaeota archaeon]